MGGVHLGIEMSGPDCVCHEQDRILANGSCMPGQTQTPIAASAGGAAASGEHLEQLRLGPREGGSGAAPSDAGGNGSGSDVAGPPNARGDAPLAVQGEQQAPPAPAVSPAEMDVLLQVMSLQETT